MQVAAMQRDLIELQDQAETSDHTTERSFLHVLDLCEAVIASLHWLRNKRIVSI